MGTEEKSYKIQVTIAIIGLVGVLGSALIANWEKVFPASTKKETVAGGVQRLAALSDNNGAIVDLPASFDCRKAETKIEKIICNNPQISHADGQLGLIYKKLRSKMAPVDFKTLKIEQREWINNRDKRILNYCQSLEGLNTGCVITIYNQRIDEFKVILAKL